MEIPTVTGINLPDFNLSYILNRPVLVVLLVLYFILYAIVSGVLVYHWSHYGMRNSGILIAESLFFFGSIFLFVVSGLTIFYF